MSFRRKFLSSFVAATLVVGTMPSLAWATPNEPSKRLTSTEQTQEPIVDAEQASSRVMGVEDDVLKTFAADTEVTIGEGTITTTYSPWYAYYYNTASAMLYKASEVGVAGSIESLAFNFYATSTDLKINYLRIYLATTTDTSWGASGNTLTAPANTTLVYENTDTSTTLGNNVTGWKTFEFNKATFDYDGTSDLMVIVVSDFSNEVGSTPKVYGTVSNGVYGTIFNKTDTHNTYQTATAGSVVGSGMTGNSTRPNVKLSIQTCAHENEAHASTTAPTCEQDGYDTYHCSDCNKDYQKNIVAALGHDFEGATSFACDNDGTANEEGKYFGYSCQRTGCAKVKVAPNPQYAGTWDGEAVDAWFNGSGTAEDPYLIESAGNLKYLSDTQTKTADYEGKYFKLMTDLDMTAGNMTPIGTSTSNYFAGVFDGNGHSITLNMSGSSNYFGLFGAAGSSSYNPAVYPEISNLVVKGTVSNAYTSASYTAGIVGYGKFVKINNCRNEAAISSTATSTTAKYIGGIIGEAYAGTNTIECCSNFGTVSSASTGDYCGGIAGYIYSSCATTIKDCYNVGAISANVVGGIVGSSAYGTSSYAHIIENCYNAGTLTGSSTGGIFGTYVASGYSSYPNYNKVVNCHWKDTQANFCGNATMPDEKYYTYSGSSAESDATMKSSAFITTMGDQYIAGNPYPSLSWEAPAGVPVISDSQLANAVYVKDFAATALSVTATSSEGYALSYQWHKNDEVIEGATQATYTPATTELGESTYYCIIKAASLELYPTMSQTATITVWSGAEAVTPVIGTQPQGAQCMQGATPTPLSVEATVSDDGVLSYQWQSAAAADGEFVNIEGATEATYAPSTQEVGTKYYRCVVTNTLEGQSTAITTTDIASVATAGCTISTAAELAAFAAEVNAGDSKTGFTTTLMADIDATDILTQPIGMNSEQYFGGTFDGNGHSIKVNLSGTTQYIALFGYTKSATIQNLTVKGSVTGAYNGGYVGGYVAGIVGYAYTGTKILNCANEAAVTSNFVGSSAGAYTGGITAYFQGSLIDRCYNIGAVSSETTNAGGVAGYAFGCTVSNCYNAGTISGASNYTGGIAGLCSGTSVNRTYYKNCYSIGKILGTSANKGVLWGNSIYDNASTTNCFYDCQVNGDMPAVVLGPSGTATATAKSTSEMQSAAALLNGEQDPAPFADDIYAQNNGYPVFAWQQAGVPEGTPAINAQSRSQAVPVSEAPLTLSVSASGAEGLTYQWAVDGEDIEGATSVSYAVSVSAAGTHVYTCTVANGELTTTSAAIQIVAYAPAVDPTVAVTPAEDQTVKQGGAAVVLTASGTSTDEGAVMSYQWQSCATSDGEFANIDGAVSAEFTIPSTELGEMFYRCVVTSTVVVPENVASATTDSVKATVIPLTIETAADWQAFAAKVNGGETLYGQTIKLANDITLTNAEFAAVGTYSSRQFTGTFDGQGHTITLSGVSTTTAATSALFGYIGEQGTVRNLNVAGTFSNTTPYVGVIAGTNKGRIEDCTSSATVKGSYSGTVYVGGIAGQSYGVIYQCANTAEASVTGNSTSTNTGSCYVGGICGYNYGQILNSYNAGAVKADCGTTNTWTYAYAGGIAGYDYHASADTWANKVENCFNAGAVTASKASDTTNTYARVGGIVGYQATDSYSTVRTYNVVNCYSVGTLTGGTTYGVMYNKTATGSALPCIIYTNLFYLDTTATKALESDTSGTITNVVAKSAEELKSAEVLAALNSGVAEGEDPIWVSVPGMNDGYPILSWMYTESPAIRFNSVTVSEDPYALSRVGEGTQAMKLVTLDATILEEGYVPTLDGAPLVKSGDKWLTLTDKSELTTADFVAAQAETTEIVSGDFDVNNSGKFTIVDVQVTYDLAKGNHTFGAEGVLNLKSWIVADVKPDNCLDSSDTFALQYKLHHGI